MSSECARTGRCATGRCESPCDDLAGEQYPEEPQDLRCWACGEWSSDRICDCGADVWREER